MIIITKCILKVLQGLKIFLILIKNETSLDKNVTLCLHDLHICQMLPLSLELNPFVCNKFDY